MVDHCCKNFPVWAVTLAVKRFIAGKVPRHNGYSMPKTAQLTPAVEDVLAADRRRLENIDRQLRTQQQIAALPAPARVTPEQMAEIRAKHGMDGKPPEPGEPKRKASTLDPDLVAQVPDQPPEFTRKHQPWRKLGDVQKDAAE